MHQGDGDVEQSLALNGCNYVAWSKEWSRLDIVAKELLPIVLACAVWGPLLSGCRVEFKCDNQSVEESIRKQSSKEAISMHLLRCLWLLSAHFDIRVMAYHIPGVVNTVADQLLRNQPDSFKLTPTSPEFQ